MKVFLIESCPKILTPFFAACHFHPHCTFPVRDQRIRREWPQSRSHLPDIFNMTHSPTPPRIQSAAFLRRNAVTPPPPTSIHTLTELPVSESRFSIITSNLHLRTLTLCVQPRHPLELRPGSEMQQRHSVSASRLPLKTSISLPSSVWRQVHSSKSALQLRSLSTSGVESVRLNLLQKVDRIANKHQQQERMYQQRLQVISQKSRSVGKGKGKESGKGKTEEGGKEEGGRKEELERMIMELLKPFEQAKRQAEDRYRARLLRIRKL